MKANVEDTVYSKESINITKKRVKNIARDLFYPDIVIQKINGAKTNAEIDRIMASARKGEYDDKYRGDL